MEKIALKYLEKNVPLHIGIMTPIFRKTATILYASHDGVFLYDRNSDIYMLSVDDFTLGKKLIDTIHTKQIFMVHQSFIFDYLNEKYPDSGTLVCYHAIYNKKEEIKIKEDIKIKVLDLSYLDEVMAHYKTIPDIEYVKGRIQSKEIFGGFVDDKLCGFIGIHAEGSMGMLEIYDEYRQKGYGTILEGYLINYILKQGFIPYAQVNTHNEKSLGLQRKLGLDLSEDKIYWLF